MKKISMKPSQFTQAFIPIQGNRFWFKDPKKDHNWREYLYPIYDNLYRTTILKTARQVEKSTLQATKIISYNALIPHFRSIYCTPTSKQARVFSNDRLRKSLRTSKFIKRYFLDPKTVDQVFEQTLINYSTVFIGYAFLTADSMRGISGDSLCIDEFQDMLSDNVPVLREMLSASDYKIYTFTGTPKTLDNNLEKEWLSSFQAVWTIKCSGCNVRNRMDTDPLKLVGKKGIICKKCGRPLRTQTGEWMKLNPESKVAGFHINRLQTARVQLEVDWEDILSKVENYPEYRIYNELFGLSFDSSEKPISRTDIRMCSNGKMYHSINTKISRGNPTFMGVDWGENRGSFNVAVVGGFTGDMFNIYNISKFSPKIGPDALLTELQALADNFKVAAIGCDHGAGHKENLRLKDRVGINKVLELYLSGSQKALWEWSKDQTLYVLNRTDMMEKGLIIPIQQRKVCFPDWETMSKLIPFDSKRAFVDDFTSLTKEYSERSRRFLYDHNGPDDIFQATLSAKFVAHLFTQRNFE